jgi:hypothetical protein
METVHNAAMVKLNGNYVMLFRSQVRAGRPVIGPRIGIIRLRYARLGRPTRRSHPGRPGFPILQTAFLGRVATGKVNISDLVALCLDSRQTSEIKTQVQSCRLG